MKQVKYSIKIKWVIAACFLLFLLFTNSFADQCAIVTKEQALTALKYLKEGTTIYEFCKPCGDISPKVIVIRDVKISTHEWGGEEISVNNKNIDLAYVYVPDNTGKYINLAFIAGSPASDVSKYLTQVTQIPKIDSETEHLTLMKEAPNIDISAKIGSELFPVIAKLLTGGNEHLNIPGLVKWTIRNKSKESFKITVISEIPEWTPPVVKTIDLGPYENKELMQTPFGTNLLRNHTSIPSTLVLKVKIEDKVIYEETKNIQIRATDDMIWSLYLPWDTEYLIAAWVTPKEPVVEQILSRAKEKIYGRSLSGYLGSNVQAEIRAIFNAVRDAGVSYVNSSINFGQVGFTQRVRLPKDSISHKEANCIDGAVLLASLFENIGLEPLIVLVPGHAFVGVKLAPGAKETLFVETTLLGREMLESLKYLEYTFDAAVRLANERYTKALYESQYNKNALHIVDIKKAREIGIYPLW